MNKNERDRLRQAYRSQAHKVPKHNSEALEYIDTLEAKAKLTKSDVWDELTSYRQSHASGVTGYYIKDALRTFLGDLQGNRCCYCRRWLLNIAHAKPIEHILSRADYPQFSIEFFNLAIACFDCNQLKGDAKWGNIKTSTLEYPPSDKFTDFFHPRIHRYIEHVSYERIERDDFCRITYTGHTTQGRHLCEKILFIVAARENLYSNIPSMAEAINSIKEHQEITGTEEPTELSKFLELLNESIDMRLDQYAVYEEPLTIKIK